MKINIPTIEVQQANIKTIDIGQVAIGPISVGSLALNNTSFTLSADEGVLTDVNVTISINIKVEWDIHIGMPDGIPDINVGDTYDLGTITFGPIGIGNVTIPGLNNVKLDIPSLTAQNISAPVTPPITIQLQNLSADKINAADFTLPTAGFSTTGISFVSAAANGLGVPAASLREADIAHVHGQPVQIPAFSLGGLNLESAQIPTINSQAPIDIPATLMTLSPGFDAGILKLLLHITPSALMQINHLELINSQASANVGGIELTNVILPYDILNLKLADIGINTLNIPSINIA